MGEAGGKAAEEVKPKSTQEAKATKTKDKPQWKVVGGSDKGGVRVRKGKDLKSAEITARLSVGTTVEELERDGNRLRFKRLDGDGPDSGWCSIASKGVSMLKE